MESEIMDYADALVRFEDEVGSAALRAENNGLTVEEVWGGGTNGRRSIHKP